MALDFCPELPRAQLVLPKVSLFLALGNLYDIVSFWTREDKSDILPLQYKLILIADIRRHVDIIYICCEQNIAQRRGTIGSDLLLLCLQIRNSEWRNT